MNDNPSPRTSPRPADLLPNEEEISYERLRDLANRHKTWLVGLFFLAILAIVGAVAWRYQGMQLQEKANARLAQAQSLDSLQAVALEFRGTDAALAADMTLADIYFQQGQWEKSAAFYRKVLESHAFSPLVGSANIGLAAILESTGKIDEALRVYQSVDSSPSAGFQAPQAALAAARLLERNHRLPEARQAYENLVARHPGTPMAREAAARLQRVNLMFQKKPAASAS